MSRRHHRQLRRGLDALVDGEAVGEHAGTTLIAHLEECEGCREELGVLRGLKASVQRIGRQRPTPLAVARLDRWSIDRFS